MHPFQDGTSKSLLVVPRGQLSDKSMSYKNNFRGYSPSSIFLHVHLSMLMKKLILAGDVGTRLYEKTAHPGKGQYTVTSFQEKPCGDGAWVKAAFLFWSLHPGTI